MTVYAIDLAKVLEWMHERGEPDPATNMNAETMILMDCALSLRRLVKLSEESMRINQEVLASLDLEDGATKN
jgi:hypothetical protein